MTSRAGLGSAARCNVWASSPSVHSAWRCAVVQARLTIAAGEPESLPASSSRRWIWTQRATPV
jgi:hypothetical protein